MVTGPGVLPVKLREQVFPESVQVGGEGSVTLPAPPTCENVTSSPSVPEESS